MKVFTGIQPTNILHVGNLFGALLPAVELQREHDLTLMIADYHSITVNHDPERLGENVLTTAATYLAAGIDSKKTVMFQQSQIPAHTELAWVLQSVARMGEAQRMVQFKDKSKNGTDSASVGLFTYPILQAADILLYDADVVPVGEDQKQHIELTRDLAERFNRDYGETFVVPEVQIPKQGARLKSLADPSKKMSKSSSTVKSFISLTDEPDLIRKKIASAVTDSEPSITLDPERAGVFNLLTIFSLTSNVPVDELAARYEGKGSKDLKEDLSDALVEYLTPIREKINGYLDDRAELIRTINNGTAAAAEIANKKLAQVRKNIGVEL